MRQNRYLGRRTERSILRGAILPGECISTGWRNDESLLCNPLHRAFGEPNTLSAHEVLLPQSPYGRRRDTVRISRQSSMARHWHRACRFLCSPSTKRSFTPCAVRLARCLNFRLDRGERGVRRLLVPLMLADGSNPCRRLPLGPSVAGKLRPTFRTLSRTGGPLDFFYRGATTETGPDLLLLSHPLHPRSIPPPL
jgi:hypothetical protein